MSCTSLPGLDALSFMPTAHGGGDFHGDVVVRVKNFPFRVGTVGGDEDGGTAVEPVRRPAPLESNFYGGLESGFLGQEVCINIGCRTAVEVTQGKCRAAHDPNARGLSGCSELRDHRVEATNEVVTVELVAGH